MTLPSAATLLLKPTGACEMDRLTKVPFFAVISTDGNGLWSERVAAVRVTDLQVPYNDNGTFGELCVYFDTDTWDVDEDGLIYTDEKWLGDLRRQLESAGYDSSDVTYSEAGMQAYNLVSLDVGKNFLASWIAINSPVEA